MISAERQKELRDVRTMLEKLRGQELPRYAADLLITLIANELSQQGLSQEDRGALESHSKWLHLAAERLQKQQREYSVANTCEEAADAIDAILRRLGGQTT